VERTALAFIPVNVKPALRKQELVKMQENRERRNEKCNLVDKFVFDRMCLLKLNKVGNNV